MSHPILMQEYPVGCPPRSNDWSPVTAATCSFDVLGGQKSTRMHARRRAAAFLSATGPATRPPVRRPSDRRPTSSVNSGATHERRPASLPAGGQRVKSSVVEITKRPLAAPSSRGRWGHSLPLHRLASEPEFWHAAYHRGNGDLELRARQCGTDAEVNASPEVEVPTVSSADVEPVGVGEPR